MVLNPKITNIPKETFEDMLDVTVDFVTENGTLLSNISWAFNSLEYNFAFLEPGEYLDIPYNIKVIDSDDVLLVDHDITITIIGTANSPIVFNLTENGADGNTEYLSANGFLYYEGVNSKTQWDYLSIGNLSYKWNVLVTAEVDTNAYIGYDAESVWQIPSNEDLVSMIEFYNVFDGQTYSYSEVPEDYAVLRWSWDASRNSESTSFRGTTFDFLAEGEYLNVTYTVTFDDKLGYTDTREITINISGTNDGPVITNKEEYVAQEASIRNFLYNIYNPNEIDGSWYYYDGGSTNVNIEDLDYSDGAMSARIIDVFDLNVSQDYMTRFPEWPGIDKLRNAVTLSFSNQKENYANTVSSIPDTTATLNVAFNNPGDNFIDFAFLGFGDDFSFKITVEVTDAKGDIDTIDIPIYFESWSDGNTITVQLTGKESDESQENIIVAQDNFDNIPHKINTGNTAALITIDRTYNPNKTIYAFYEIELESLDRSGDIVYSSIFSTSEIDDLSRDYGWPIEYIPRVRYAYNLSDAQKFDISKYTAETLQLPSQPGDPTKINDIPLKRIGEFINTINIMIEIPHQALNQTWPSFGGSHNIALRGVNLRMTNLAGNRDNGVPPKYLPIFIYIVDLADIPSQE